MPSNETNRVAFQIRISASNAAKVKIIAAAENRSMTNLIEYFVMQGIAKYEKENGTVEVSNND